MVVFFLAGLVVVVLGVDYCGAGRGLVELAPPHNELNDFGWICDAAGNGKQENASKLEACLGEKMQTFPRLNNVTITGCLSEEVIRHQAQHRGVSDIELGAAGPFGMTSMGYHFVQRLRSSYKYSSSP